MPHKPNQPLPSGPPFILRHQFTESQTMQEHLATFWELSTRYEREMMVSTLEIIEKLRQANDQGNVVLSPYSVGNREV